MRAISRQSRPAQILASLQIRGPFRLDEVLTVNRECGRFCPFLRAVLNPANDCFFGRSNDDGEKSSKLVNVQNILFHFVNPFSKNFVKLS